MQLRLFSPVSTWVPTPVSALPSWDGATRVSVDVETRDPFLKKLGPSVRRGGYVVGYSFGLRRPGAHDQAWYVPIRHEAGGNVDPGAALEYLRRQARDFRGELVGANLQYDLDYLAELGVEFSPSFFRDVQVAEPLLDELQYSYSLDAIASRCGLEGKSEELLRRAAVHHGLDSKADLWRLPAHLVGPYAEGDALLPLEILDAQDRRIDATDAADERVQAGKAPSLRSLWDLESRLLPVLLAMRRRGVRVDLGHLDVVEARCVREEEDACAAFSLAAGKKVTPGDLKKQAYVGPIIEQVLGRRLPSTKTGKVELQAKKLKALRHPTIDLFLRACRFRKLRNDFVEGIRRHHVRGRVHTTFNQVKRAKDEESDDDEGTISGRLSSVDPNLQQQPTRDPDIGPLWRRIYLADEGAEWACLDYSKQEPRWLVHFAAVSGCTGAVEMREAYRSNPGMDLYTALAERVGWTGDEGYNRSKTVYLGLSYGEGGKKLSLDLGLPTKWIVTRAGRDVEVAGDEAQRLIDDFFRGVPFIPELNDRAQKATRRHGFVRSVLGRRLHFERRRDGGPGYDELHKAVNKIVQGSSADQTKRAMVLAHEAGIALQLQVHDELDLSVADRGIAFRLAEIMLDAVPCTVPHRVSPEFGPSWGQLA